jgi:hypothetical protein
MRSEAEPRQVPAGSEGWPPVWAAHVPAKPSRVEGANPIAVGTDALRSVRSK